MVCGACCLLYAIYRYLPTHLSTIYTCYFHIISSHIISSPAQPHSPTSSSSTNPMKTCYKKSKQDALEALIFHLVHSDAAKCRPPQVLCVDLATGSGGARLPEALDLISSAASVPYRMCIPASIRHREVRILKLSHPCFISSMQDVKFHDQMPLERSFSLRGD